MTVDRRRWVALVFISISVSLIIVDSTIVNVAIPSIVDDLDISSTQVQWVQESYTLVFASFLLVFGTLADRFGRKRLLMIGVTVFAIASVAAALAPTGGLLIVARVLQGFGGAMVLPCTLSLINATFRGAERGFAFAIWGSTIGGMVAVGPLLGGWLTTYYTWRWAFGINLPIAAAILVGAALTVTESTDESASRRIDAVGALLSVAASATLVFSLVEGRSYGWWNVRLDRLPPFLKEAWPFSVSPVPIAFAVAAVSTVGFIWWGVRRRRRGLAPLLALGLFSIPSFRNGNIAATIVSLGEFGIILSLPLWLQNVLGYDALQTGFVLLALAAGSFLASGISGAFGSRITPETIVRCGIGAEMVGVFGLGVIISAHASWAEIVPFLFVYGVGVGLATAQLTGVVLKDVPVASSGQGSGTASTARQVGSALGIAVLGSVLFTSTGTALTNRLESQVPSVPQQARSAIVDTVVVSAGGVIPALDDKDLAIGRAASEAFSDGTRYAAFSAAGFLALGLAATTRLTARAGREPSGERPDRDESPDAVER